MTEQNKPAQSNPDKSVTTPPMPVKHTRDNGVNLRISTGSGVKK